MHSQIFSLELFVDGLFEFFQKLISDTALVRFVQKIVSFAERNQRANGPAFDHLVKIADPFPIQLKNLAKRRFFSGRPALFR